MEELYKQNVKIVYHFLYTRCKDAALTEELLQDTFLKAFESMERYVEWCCFSVQKTARNEKTPVSLS